jgi:hypothetical protein
MEQTEVKNRDRFGVPPDDSSSGESSHGAIWARKHALIPAGGAS